MEVIVRETTWDDIQTDNVRMALRRLLRHYQVNPESLSVEQALDIVRTAEPKMGQDQHHQCNWKMVRDSYISYISTPDRFSYWLTQCTSRGKPCACGICTLANRMREVGKDVPKPVHDYGW
jgi:hypothetical protein